MPNQDIEELLDKYENDIKDGIVEGSARDRMIGVLKRHGRDVQFAGGSTQKGATSSRVLANGFDPNQPRDEKGRWTDGGGFTRPDVQDYSNQLVKTIRSVAGQGAVSAMFNNKSGDDLTMAGTVRETDLVEIGKRTMEYLGVERAEDEARAVLGYTSGILAQELTDAIIDKNVTADLQDKIDLIDDAASRLPYVGDFKGCVLRYIDDDFADKLLSDGTYTSEKPESWTYGPVKIANDQGFTEGGWSVILTVPKESNGFGCLEALSHYGSAQNEVLSKSGTKGTIKELTFKEAKKLLKSQNYDINREVGNSLDGMGKILLLVQEDVKNSLEYRIKMAIRIIERMSRIHDNGFDPSQPRDEKGMWTDTGGYTKSDSGWSKKEEQKKFYEASIFSADVTRFSSAKEFMQNITDSGVMKNEDGSYTIRCNDDDGYTLTVKPLWSRDLLEFHYSDGEFDTTIRYQYETTNPVSNMQYKHLKDKGYNMDGLDKSNGHYILQNFGATELYFARGIDMDTALIDCAVYNSMLEKMPNIMHPDRMLISEYDKKGTINGANVFGSSWTQRTGDEYSFIMLPSGSWGVHGYADTFDTMAHEGAHVFDYSGDLRDWLSGYVSVSNNSRGNPSISVESRYGNYSWEKAMKADGVSGCKYADTDMQEDFACTMGAYVCMMAGINVKDSYATISSETLKTKLKNRMEVCEKLYSAAMDS